MLAAIDPPCMLLQDVTKCIILHWYSDLGAVPRNCQYLRAMPSHAESEPMVSHTAVSILTASWLSRACQSVQSAASYLNEFWHLQSGCLHQHNVYLFWKRTQTSHTRPSILPVYLAHSICSQAPLELSNMLSDSARACSSASESTSRYGGAFRMLQYLTHRIVKFWSHYKVCTDLWETLRAAEISAQLCRRL